MCTLPQGATKSVAHMMNVMNKVLRDCISEITMPFLDDIPMKGCVVEEKDETMDDRGFRKFVVDHIHDCEKVLRNLEDVHLTLSEEKSTFGQEKIFVVGHLCGPFGRTPSQTKIDVIQAIKYVSHNPKSEGFSVHVHFITYGFRTMHILRTHLSFVAEG